jgi:hypothetical protein
MVAAGLLLIAAGLGVIAWGFSRFRRRSAASALAAGAWASVEGTLTAAEIREEIEYDSDNDPVVHHAPQVAYGYDVGGRSFTGTRAFFSRERFDSEDQARAWLQGKAAGSRVTVWHDPRDPERSVLELDHPARGELIGYIVGGVVLAGIGMTFFT